MTETAARTPAPGAIAFIGGGNMARSLIAGLVGAAAASASIRVAEPLAGVREALHQDFGVAVFDDIADAVAGADTWVLAAKPQAMRAICDILATGPRQGTPLVLSIAAGITTAQLDRWLGGDLPIVRAMPNTPALLGAGATGLFANARADAGRRADVEHLLASTGAVVWLREESMMDAVTAVSGSGPAYVFLLAEAMLGAARAQGLPDEVAHTLVTHTVLGAARMLVEGDANPGALRARVTSPGGTTEAAIAVLQQGGFDTLVADAIDAACQRSVALSAQPPSVPCP